MNSWSPSDTPISSLEPCDTSWLDVARLGGLKPRVLLDLIYLMGLLEEQGWMGVHPPPKRTHSEEIKEPETQYCLDEGESHDGKWLLEDEWRRQREQKVEGDLLPSQNETNKTADSQESTSSAQTPQTSQISKDDSFLLELRAVKVSYLLTGGLKTLAVFFSCEKLSDLLLVPKPDPPKPSVSPLSSSTPDQAKASSVGWDKVCELRSVLQYVVQTMVKWAVRPCPIKQIVSLADLERAQVMIYMGALNRQEDKEHKGI